MEATYKVSGMTCGGCVSSVTKALQLALPDATVEVNLASATAKVVGDHDEATVRKAVEDAGFDYSGRA
jgi:copper chaperone